MPYSLYCWGVSNSPAPETVAEPEWKIFHNLRSSGGGISALVILYFCLSFYLVLYQHNVQQLSCTLYLVWICTYTTALFLFRVVHEVSLLRWKCSVHAHQTETFSRNIDSEISLQRSILCFVWLHLLSIPVFVVLTAVGFFLLSVVAGEQHTTCVQNDTLILSYIFLWMSIPVLGLKWFLFYMTLYRKNLSYLARTKYERRFASGMTPQFLREGDAVADTWSLTFPIVENPQKERCTICLEDIDIGAPVRNVPCGHRYHMKCLDRWLKDSTQCPMCMRVIKKNHPLESWSRRNQLRDSTSGNGINNVRPNNFAAAAAVSASAVAGEAETVRDPAAMELDLDLDLETAHDDPII